MISKHQDEMMVDQFYDLITAAERPVMHSAHFVPNQDNTLPWEWELAGTYIIANSCSTVAMACDGLRLARFTAPTGPLAIDNQMRGFLPNHYKRSYENDTFYDLFDQILAVWSIVRNCAIYEREHLISLCQSEKGNSITMIMLDLTVIIAHILSFCNATKENLITCLVVVNQSPTPTARLKLMAGQLEELFIPIV